MKNIKKKCIKLRNKTQNNLFYRFIKKSYLLRKKKKTLGNLYIHLIKKLMLINITWSATHFSVSLEL